MFSKSNKSRATDKENEFQEAEAVAASKKENRTEILMIWELSNNILSRALRAFSAISVWPCKMVALMTCGNGMAMVNTFLNEKTKRQCHCCHCTAKHAFRYAPYLAHYLWRVQMMQIYLSLAVQLPLECAQMFAVLKEEKKTTRTETR